MVLIPTSARLSVVSVVRVILVVLLMCASRVAVAGVPVATSDDEPRLKAAILYNIWRFVDWPDEHEFDEFVVAVLEATDEEVDFVSIDGKVVHEMPTSIRIVSLEDETPACRAVYFGSEVAGELDTVLDRIGRRGVLTMSGADGFCEAGGMIQLVRRGDRIHFRINKQAAIRAGLKLSSQVLKIAEVVETDRD